MKKNLSLVAASLLMIAAHAHAGQIPTVTTVKPSVSAAVEPLAPTAKEYQKHLAEVQAAFQVSYFTKSVENADARTQLPAVGILTSPKEATQGLTNGGSLTLSTLGAHATVAQSVQEVGYISEVVNNVPVVKKLEFGKTFSVEPLARNGKSLTVQMKGSVSELLSLENFAVPVVHTDEPDGVSGIVHEKKYNTVQLPHISVESFDQTVSLKEGETLVLRSWSEQGQQRVITVTLKHLNVAQ